VSFSFETIEYLETMEANTRISEHAYLNTRIKKTAHSPQRECAVVELLLQTLEGVIGSDGPVRAVKAKWRRTT